MQASVGVDQFEYLHLSWQLVTALELFMGTSTQLSTHCTELEYLAGKLDYTPSRDALRDLSLWIVAEHGSPGSMELPEQGLGNWHARALWRLLRERVDTQHTVSAGKGVDPNTLYIDDDVRGFRLGGNSWVSLSATPVLRRLFDVLVTTRVAYPGQAIDVYGLIESIWPNDMSSQKA